MFVLSQLSEPSVNELKYCAAGVRTHEVMKKQLRIRVLPGTTAGDEQVQLVVVPNDVGKGVEAGKMYI